MGLTNARTFMANSDLKEAMGAAGIIEAPDVYPAMIEPETLRRFTRWAGSR